LTAPPEGKAPYPQHRVADVVLRDGSTVHIRPLREEDEQPLVDFLLGLSERSRWFRFFSAWGNLAEFAEKAVDADYRRRLDLVATAGTPPKIIAHAVYAGIAPDRAEDSAPSSWATSPRPPRTTASRSSKPSRCPRTTG
jgi:hypothetical protein